MAKSYVVDFDDLCDRHDPFDELMALKERWPQLKVTLFAIPKRCSAGLIDRYAALDWVELAIHGYHHSNMECADWGKDEALQKLKEGSEILRGSTLFKAPGWIANPRVYEAVKELGFSVSDNANFIQQWENDGNERRYVYNLSGRYKPIHGHLWEVCNNGPSRWAALFEDVPDDAEFLFVTEALGNFDENDLSQHNFSSWSHSTAFGRHAAANLQRFIETINPQAPVADFGGNDGYAAAMRGNGIVEVVDGSPARIEFAKSNYRLKAHCEDFADLPFADGYFDWGFCSHTLEHLPNLDECWAEMQRVCRTGIWVVVPVESQEEFDQNPAHLVRHSHEEWLERLGAVEVDRGGAELICKWVR